MRNSRSLREYLEAETGLKAIKPDGIPCLENLAKKDTIEYFDLIASDNKVSLLSGSDTLERVSNYYNTNPLLGRVMLSILDEEGNYRNSTIGEGKFTEYARFTIFQDRIRISRSPIKKYSDEFPKELSFAT